MKQLLCFFFSFVVWFMLLIPSFAFAQCGSDCTEFISTFPSTLNGITVTADSTGSVSSFINPYDNSCGATVVMPGNSLHLGQSGSFEYTFIFSIPVNDVIVLITAASQITTTPLVGEAFDFSVNGGTPVNLVQDCGCLTISGSTVTCTSCTDDGGLIIVSSANDFTTLTISGDGGSAGSLFGLCALSLEQYCNIEAEESDVICNNGNTPVDPTDDTFSFQLELIGSSTGISWISDDPTLGTGTYDTPYTFGPYPMNGGPKTINFTDIDDPDCMLEWTVEPPEPCNENCILELASAVDNIICNNANTPSDPTDDFFTFDLEVGGSFTGLSWISDDLTVGMGNYNTVYNFGPYLMSDGDVSINFTDIDVSNCNLELTVSPPDPCYDIPELQVYLPNIFSPNSDGNNDYFFPMSDAGIEDEVLEMLVYDRWGNLVFQNQNFAFNDPFAGWNGRFKNKDLNPGVYVYMLKVLRSNGEEKSYSGNVTILE